MGRALVDANVLVGLYRSDDSLHKDAVKLVTKLKGDGFRFVLTNLVLQETATVLSMRVGMGLAEKLLKDYKNIIDEEIFINEGLEMASWKVFLRQKKKGTSFVDCANLAVVEKYKLDGILTFDKFYPKSLRLV